MALGLYILNREVVQDLDAQLEQQQFIVDCMRKNTCKKQIMHDCNVVSAAAVHFNVWYNRLGHMSVGKMHLVSENAKFHNNNDKNFVCEICPRAK